MPRAAFVVAAIVAALVLRTSASASAAGAPTITLLTPANGATFESSVSTTPPRFSWHVDWATPENTTLRFETASDSAFTHNVTVDTNFCPVSDVNCWTSVQPHSVYGPPYGSVWYWRVGLTTSGGIVYSPTFMFRAVAPPAPSDRDHDGIVDANDNCPDRTNADQRDSNHDGQGDACQPDRVKPRVKATVGHARRGARAFFTAQVADDRDVVRLRVTLSYDQHILYGGSFGWTQTRWGVPHTFYTRTPLPRFLPIGTYQACIKAWDKAGNNARACSRYSVT